MEQNAAVSTANAHEPVLSGKVTAEIHAEFSEMARRTCRTKAGMLRAAIKDAVWLDKVRSVHPHLMAKLEKDIEAAQRDEAERRAVLTHLAQKGK